MSLHDGWYEYYMDYILPHQLLEEVLNREQATSYKGQLQTITANLDAQIKLILQTLHTVPGYQTKLQPLAQKAALYGVSSALIARGEYNPFLSMVGSMCQLYGLPCTPGDMERSFRTKTPLFKQEGVLNKGECGTFWKELMTCLPPNTTGAGTAYAEPLRVFFIQIEQLYMELWGKQAKQFFLDTPFSYHHQLYSMLRGDVEDLKTTIRQESSTDTQYHFTKSYRDLLTASFPEVAQWVDLRAIAHRDEGALIEETYKKNPTLAIAMWQLLLDTAEERLGDTVVARRLLCIEIAGRIPQQEAWHCDHGFYDPILDALESNDHFAKQLCQSAILDGDFMSLLVICCVRGRIPLMEHLRKLVLQSPYFHQIYPNGMSKWVLRLPQGRWGNPHRANHPTRWSEETSGAKMYRYVHVEIENIIREYAYLCQDETIVAGAFVRIPFGNENRERKAKVKQVGLYTAAQAPYPPQYTKSILGRWDENP